MKKILVTAYAVNPYKGSEDGMGWNFVLQIARFHQVIAITRENNKAQIEAYQKANPDERYANIHFLYFDLPYWKRFWKRGGQGAMLYYWLWQQDIIGFIKKQRLEYDVVHNLNFHNDWTPSFLWKLNKPFVWGPVGHHAPIPDAYLKDYGWSYKIQEYLKWAVKKMFWNWSTALSHTVAHAAHILCMNSSAAKVLKLDGNYSIVPSVATQDYGWMDNKSAQEKFRLISAGRLVPLKGFDLTIAAFEQFLRGLSAEEAANCSLSIVGSGAWADYYQKMVDEKGLSNHISFVKWVARADLLELFRNASAFVFPSHEGAGMVVAEALSFGLPVICLDNDGPGEFINEESGFAVPLGDKEATIRQLAERIKDLYDNPELLQQKSIGARQRFEQGFDWNIRGLQLKQIYENL